MRSILTILLVLVTIYLHAQKLPKVQQVSLRAPTNIKIDGKANEWGDKFQAYNKATDMYYTLSNDDENLYLAIRVEKTYVLENIMNKGLRFIINHSASKKEESPAVVTYPVLTLADRVSIHKIIDARFNDDPMNPPDHSINALNSLFQSKAKFIRIEGIGEITEKEIPIYNAKDIRVAAAYNEPLTYFCELAIPLKLLYLNNISASPFNYHIIFNYQDKGSRPPAPPSTPGALIMPPAPVYVGTTDFWGEYTLAK